MLRRRFQSREPVLLRILDETLMAFADGELPKAEATEIERQIAADPELQQRLRVYQSTRAPIAAAFSGLLDLPLPGELVARINERMQSAGQPQADRTVQRAEVSYGVLDTLRRLLLGGEPGANIRLGPALASVAFAALAAGAVGWMLRGDDVALADRSARGGGTMLVSEGGALLAGKVLAAALERQPSGGQTDPVVMVATFNSRSGEICREYGVAGRESYAGVACRQDAGAWRVELHTQVANTKFASTTIKPASGGGSAAYEAAVDALRDGDVLDATREAQTLQRWGGQ